MIELGPQWAPRLTSQPETGMGYQIAAVLLRDGSRFEDVVIVGGTITSVRGYGTIVPFAADDIVDIIVERPR